MRTYLYHCGPRERCIPSPAEQKLSIAEAYAFGAATSRNIEGRFLSALVKGEPEALEAWAAIAQYNHFLVEHRELYRQAAPAARIALISAEPLNPLADEFLKQSVFFETKVLAHLDKGVPLDQFKVLVVPADLPKLSAEQKARWICSPPAAGHHQVQKGGAGNCGARRSCGRRAPPQPETARLRTGPVDSETRRSDFDSPPAQLRPPSPGRGRESPAGAERARPGP